jgi:hypothetical protein
MKNNNLDRELYEALRTKNIDNVKFLIRKNADINAIINHNIFGPIKTIDMFRITLCNPFDINWVNINEYLKSKN